MVSRRMHRPRPRVIVVAWHDEIARGVLRFVQAHAPRAFDVDFQVDELAAKPAHWHGDGAIAGLMS
ncbi:MAG: hypothetical protein ACYS5V_09620, partial [Planctomycetota bacterium]